MLRARFTVSDVVLPEDGQPLAMQVEIHLDEVCAQPVVVLHDVPIAHLVEEEDALQDAKHMLAPHPALLAIGQRRKHLHVRPMRGPPIRVRAELMLLESWE